MNTPAAAASVRVPGVGLPRLLAGIRASEPVSLADHLRQHGPIPRGLWRHRPGLVELVQASGLRGRGGGGFPTADKLRAVATQRGRPVVVVNALEGEPVSGKDKALLRHAPHLVLDGAAVAARALGARIAIVAVCEEAAPERDTVATALVARERAGTDEGVELSLVSVPPGFVSGEETALVHFLNGGPALPTTRPPLPFERGVGGAPTLVQNAETLAHLALIARHGAAWFRAIGTPAEPGSMLVTVSGAIERPGVFELAFGTPLSTVIAHAGGFSERPRALLVGGYFGSWVSAARAESLVLGARELDAVGARIGAGAIAVLPASVCAVGETARVARYLADESAGQCGPCVHGLTALADTLAHLAGDPPATAPRTDARRVLTRFLGQIGGRGACRHPDGAVRFVRSALEVFADEFERHLAGGSCGLHTDPVLPLPRRRAR